MSATIVKTLTTVKIDGKWYLKGNSCESNVYPHTYSKWTGKDGFVNREELDGRIVTDFYLGNFRGGSSYSLFVRELIAGIAKSEAYDRYLKLRKIHDTLFEYSMSKRYADEWPTLRDRCDRIRIRIGKWESELYAKLGRDFRDWTPDKRRFKVKVNGGYLSSIGQYRYKYTYSDFGKTFSAIQAKEFCIQNAAKKPEMIAA